MAAEFPPKWFEGDWVVTGSVEAVPCSAGTRITWTQSGKCMGTLYEKGVLANPNPTEKARKALCVNPAAGSEHFFPAEMIDQNTFVMKGRPFLQKGEMHSRQTALSAKFFHRCNRR